MAETKNLIVETETRNVDYTIPLTEAAESGAISPNEYARRRASIVGENNILEYIIIPILMALWRRLFQSNTSRRVPVKSESDKGRMAA